MMKSAFGTALGDTLTSKKEDFQQWQGYIYVL